MKAGLQTMGVLRSNDSFSQEPVALETAVVATGARPGDTAAKRQLFTEETQTVLVFERGAVIRLSAAVADGQLLFLTNKATGKEVVAQVLRKRAFRPTNCYVDLEFTEACSGFWGIEFPKTGGASIAEKAQVSGDHAESESDSPQAAAPPDAQEVLQLKQEVSALQDELKSLRGSGSAEHGTIVESSAGITKRPAEVADDVAKRDEERRLSELFAIEARQEAAAGPKRLVSYPQKTAAPLASSRSSSGKSGKSGKKIAALIFLLLTAGGVAAYQFGALDSVIKKPLPPKPTATVASTNAAKAAPVSARVSVPAQPSPALNPPPVNPAAAAALGNGGVPAATGSTNSMASTSSVVEPRIDSRTNAAKEPSREVFGSSARSAAHSPSRPAVRSTPSRSAAPKGSPPGANPAGDVASQPATTVVQPLAAPVSDAAAGGDYIAPKLLKSVKPVTPSTLMRNYVTGNVNVDALIDTTGHVKSVTVLSGPSKLRANAIEELKQYVYEPARRNGKAVPAHVQLSLQYWYEP